MKLLWIASTHSHNFKDHFLRHHCTMITTSRPVAHVCYLLSALRGIMWCVVESSTLVIATCSSLYMVCCRSTYNHESGAAYAMPKSLVKIGQLCAAKYSGTNEWHRCFITGFKEQQVKVSISQILIFCVGCNAKI